ncbi:RidA family protein [Sphingomonas sp. LT1P40]|uniref:RidA family protein n=1 Tax=Alteristakelama amylovorans TaxID=3096166 RepID=UPI002FC982E9
MPIVNYVPFTVSGRIVHLSGQLSRGVADEVRGTVGVDVDLDRAVYAARLCAINLIAQAQTACDGDLDRVTRVLKLGGFVQAGPDFEAIPTIINGASNLIVEAFGDRGRHARSAVGVFRLPMGYAVEVDAVIEIAT